MDCHLFDADQFLLQMTSGTFDKIWITFTYIHVTRKFSVHISNLAASIWFLEVRVRHNHAALDISK